MNRAARVVSAWAEQGAYCDETGAPGLLPFESETESSFARLVSVNGGARAVLDELPRVGAIDREEEGLIRRRQRAYIPARDEEAKFAFLGIYVADLMASIEHNLDPKSDTLFFQRKVAYDNLPPGYLPALREYLERAGQAFLEELNEDMSRHDRDVTGDSADGSALRSMVGIYYYEEPNDAEE